MMVDTVRQTHPLIHAGKWLLADLLSTLTFVAVYAITHSIYVATGLGIAFGLGQVAYLKNRRAPIDTMQWLSLGLVIVFGGATLLTHNPIFIKVKFTLIYTAIAVVMLKRGWMTRYMPPIAQARGGDISDTFGYVWSALMFGTGAANLVMAAYASPAAWGWFLGVFPLASKIVLVFTQYGVTRFIIRRRIRMVNEAALAAA